MHKKDDNWVSMVSNVTWADEFPSHIRSKSISGIPREDLACVEALVRCCDGSQGNPESDSAILIEIRDSNGIIGPRLHLRDGRWIR